MASSNHFTFNPVHCLQKTIIRPVSLNILDEAIKITHFINFQPWNIVCDEMGSRHQAFPKYIPKCG